MSDDTGIPDGGSGTLGPSAAGGLDRSFLFINLGSSSHTYIFMMEAAKRKGAILFAILRCL